MKRIAKEKNMQFFGSDYKVANAHNEQAVCFCSSHAFMTN
jgi:hypothetical protein